MADVEECYIFPRCASQEHLPPGSSIFNVLSEADTDFHDIVSNSAVLSQAVYYSKKDECENVFRRNRHSITKVTKSQHGLNDFLIAEDNNRIYVAFCGSKTKTDLLRHASSATLQYDKVLSENFHSGFLSSAVAFPISLITRYHHARRKQQKGACDLVFCGHSAGGPVASIAMLIFHKFLDSYPEAANGWASLKCVTFAAPAFAELKVIGLLEVGVAATEPQSQICHFVYPKDAVPGIVSILVPLSKKKRTGVARSAVALVSGSILTETEVTKLINDLCLNVKEKQFKKLRHLGKFKMFTDVDVIDVEYITSIDEVGLLYGFQNWEALCEHHAMANYMQMVQKMYKNYGHDQVSNWSEEYVPKIEDSCLSVYTYLNSKDEPSDAYLTLYGTNIDVDLCAKVRGMIKLRGFEFEAIEWYDVPLREPHPSAVKIKGRVKRIPLTDYSTSEFKNIFGSFKENFPVSDRQEYNVMLTLTMDGSVSCLVRRGVLRSLFFSAYDNEHSIIAAVKELTILTGNDEGMTERLDEVLGRQSLDEQSRFRLNEANDCLVAEDVTHLVLDVIDKGIKEKQWFPWFTSFWMPDRTMDRTYQSLLTNLIKTLKEKLRIDTNSEIQRLLDTINCNGTVSDMEKDIMTLHQAIHAHFPNDGANNDGLVQLLSIVDVIRRIRELQEKELFVGFVGNGTANLTTDGPKGWQYPQDEKDFAKAIQIFHGNVYYLKFSTPDNSFHLLKFMNNINIIIESYERDINGDGEDDDSNNDDNDDDDGGSDSIGSTCSSSGESGSSRDSGGTDDMRTGISPGAIMQMAAAFEEKFQRGGERSQKVVVCVTHALEIVRDIEDQGEKVMQETLTRWKTIFGGRIQGQVERIRGSLLSDEECNEIKESILVTDHAADGDVSNGVPIGISGPVCGLKMMLQNYFHRFNVVEDQDVLVSILERILALPRSTSEITREDDTQLQLHELAVQQKGPHATVVEQLNELSISEDDKEKTREEMIAAGQCVIYPDVTFLKGHFLDTNSVAGEHLKEIFNLSYVPSEIKECKGPQWINLSLHEKPIMGSAYYVPTQDFLEIVNTAAVLSAVVNETKKDKLLKKLEENGGYHDITKVAATIHGHYHFMIGEGKSRVYIAFGSSKEIEDVKEKMEANLLYDKELMGTFYEKFFFHANKFPDSLITKLIDDGRDLVFCGHSTGGAVAALVMLKFASVLRRLCKGSAAHKKLKCVTFIAPGFGQLEDGSDAPLEQMYHFDELGDIISSDSFAKKRHGKEASTIVEVGEKVTSQWPKTVPPLSLSPLWQSSLSPLLHVPSVLELMAETELLSILQGKSTFGQYKELVQNKYPLRMSPSTSQSISPYSINENHLPIIQDAVVVVHTYMNDMKQDDTIFLTIFGTNIDEDICIVDEIDLVGSLGENVKIEIIELQEPASKEDHSSALKVHGKIRRSDSGKKRVCQISSISNLNNIFSGIKEPFPIDQKQVFVTNVTKAFFDVTHVRELIKCAVQRSLLFSTFNPNHEIIAVVRKLAKLAEWDKSLEEELKGVLDNQEPPEGIFVTEYNIVNKVADKFMALLNDNDTGKTTFLSERLESVTVDERNYDKLLSNMIHILKTPTLENNFKSKIHGSVNEKEDAVMLLQDANPSQLESPIQLVQIARKIRMLLNRDVFVAIAGKQETGISIVFHRLPTPKDSVYFLKFPSANKSKENASFQSLLSACSLVCILVEFDDSKDGGEVSVEDTNIAAHAFINMFRGEIFVEVRVCISHTPKLLCNQAQMTEDVVATRVKNCVYMIRNRISEIRSEEEGREEYCPLTDDQYQAIRARIRLTDCMPKTLPEDAEWNFVFQGLGLFKDLGTEVKTRVQFSLWPCPARNCNAYVESSKLLTHLKFFHRSCYRNVETDGICKSTLYLLIGASTQSFTWSLQSDHFHFDDHMFVIKFYHWATGHFFTYIVVLAGPEVAAKYKVEIVVPGKKSQNDIKVFGINEVNDYEFGGFLLTDNEVTSFQVELEDDDDKYQIFTHFLKLEYRLRSSN